VIEKDFTRLLQKENEYIGKGSGFTLQCIDGLLLGVYKYIPIGGSSYIKLLDDIRNKKAVISLQNTDQQCFKLVILTKNIDKYRNQTMFIDEEHFSGLKFPTPTTDIKIFERNNLNVSINMYDLKQNKKNHIIYP
jgi:hypothetical protein